MQERGAVDEEEDGVVEPYESAKKEFIINRSCK